MQSRKISTSPNPSYSFHGSNSSNSKDNGSVVLEVYRNMLTTSYASVDRVVELTTFPTTRQVTQMKIRDLYR
ncbi:uncharacterized protein LACBIDRAFT_311655 [Laccaria bicolor S238N-H82]|uniref:Predicted protein n=1 Tax=Laccaria bicolor (strain S238N-H82 / ATCC MYA-4686) TaxID=486041 RepID=B0CXY2_LACBS|nr:uncharacterized protein LACBIDRAFT_311655 [Laccaria bicolor S238N-H82]EDR12346.1 predicted protein [Laccaria bicolor S238N-H82]|eukprot:XP_001876610.1 predicted protein [Laccaria bicolor S238N-H82]